MNHISKINALHLDDAIKYEESAQQAAPTKEPCNPLCELCVKRGYISCANVAVTTPIPTQAASNESDPNAPWLTKAHILCTDHGVPQGSIEWRIETLTELLAQAAPTKEPNAKLVEACELVDDLIEHQFTGTSAGMNDLQYACDAVHAALDLYKKDQKMNTSQEPAYETAKSEQMPLTDEQIEDIAIGIAADDYDHDLVRRVERYHGIGGKVCTD